ncbi:hypothetical protein [Streptomyces sp. SBT349]|uniref:hypothetical protein n=1 Tax=Streptomyces sp. SBT349 TaxID=1580539 RepID=UPI00069F4E4D|nr:hypothetical protein [Streptomyces sp. SBT349]
MVIALVAGGITAATAAPTSAEPITKQACRDNPISYRTTNYNGEHEWPARSAGFATTGPNCVDINVRPNQTVSVRTCFSRTASCNSWRSIPANTWGLAATNVLDGTDYWLEFNRDSTGQIAD